MKLREDWVMLGRPVPCKWHPFQWEVINVGPATFYPKGQLVILQVKRMDDVVGCQVNGRDMRLILVRAPEIAGLSEE